MSESTGARWPSGKFGSAARAIHPAASAPGTSKPMVLTFNNRETFLVLQWLESQPGRHYFTDLARSLARVNADTAVPRLAEAILVALEPEFPKLEGIAD